MYPATHMTVAVSAVSTANRILGANPEAVDYRIVALGAIIPDLIDKPLKWFLFPKQLPDDHLWGHTLALPLAMIAAGTLLARRGEPRLLWLGLGALTHPLIDPVLIEPRTLFWPLLGTRFPVAHGFIARGAAIGADLALMAAGTAALAKSERVRAWAQRFLHTGTINGQPLS